MKVVIINYGAGNIKSIQFAFQRLGINATFSNKPEEIQSADRIIFPGVGEASSAMQKLKISKLDILIPTLKQPVLGICLGMQLMCNYSEEGNTKGLEIFNTNVKRFSNNLKVPQMGWNSIHDLNSNLFKGIYDDDYMYSVHSYYADINDQTIAISRYGITYATAFQNTNFYGVQFHPEKSSDTGALLLKNFLNL